jgi:hypothetical protein
MSESKSSGPTMQTVETLPRQRRRRWVAATVFGLLIAVAWWLWPRGDKRFVGTWGRDFETRATTFTFHANNSGFIVSRKGAKLPLRWWMEGNILCQQPGVKSGIAGAWDRLQDLVGKVTGNVQPALPVTRLFIVRVEADKIVFKTLDRDETVPADGTPEMTLIRLPE